MAAFISSGPCPLRLRLCRAARLTFVTIIAALSVCRIADAQPARTATLQGTVTDQAGGSVAGATVTIVDTASLRRQADTDEQGHYRFEQLSPGQYSIEISAPGFLPYTGFAELRPGRSATADAVLRIGISVSLEVREPTGLSTDPRKNLSALTLTGPGLQSLPEDPRRMLQRLMEMAGSNGRRGDVAVYVDGFREYRRIPPKAAIEMVRINSNPFSAEFSQPSARRIEITTRPGSDSVHGDLAVQARNSRLDARNPLAEGRPLSSYRNIAGYLQGPIKKERMGFLIYGGGWRQDENAFIRATTLDSLGNPTRFLSTVRTPATSFSFQAKTDIKLFGQLLNVSFLRTVEDDRSQGLDGGLALAEHGFDRRTTDSTTRLWWTAIRKSALHDFRVEVSRATASTTPLAGTPAVIVLDAFSAGTSLGAPYRTSTLGVQIIETLTFLRGNHGIKVGGQLETTSLQTVDRSGYAGAFTFGSDVERDSSGRPLLAADGSAVAISPIESYRRTLLGLPGYAPSQFTITSGDPSVAARQLQIGGFALDDWSPSRRWSLSYGARYEAQTNIGGRLYLAPRAAFSWLLDAKSKNALKFGAGLFYSRVDAGITLDTRRLDGVRRRQTIVAQPDFFTVIPSQLASGGLARSAVYLKDPALRAPRALVAMVSYERQLPRGWFGVVQYTSTSGQQLLRLRNLGSDQIGAAGQPIGPVLQFESTGRSQQHELLMGLRGGLSKRATMFANYRLGQIRSDTDGPYTTPARSGELGTEYGYSIDDRRHQIAAGGGVGLLGVTVEPELSLLSGRPFNITTGRDNNGDSVFTDRPAFAEAGDPGAVVTAFGIFNPNPDAGDRLVPRNHGREPWQWSLDVAVFKALNRVTVTVDAENIFNTRRLTRLNGVVTSPVFGLANRALNARRFELSVRYAF